MTLPFFVWTCIGKRFNTPPLPVGRARYLAKCQVNFGLIGPAQGAARSNLFQDHSKPHALVHEVRVDQIDG
jgi:hypothetical protein